jgi:hypothetical protein
MNDKSLNQIERQLADSELLTAPRELRTAVLRDIERELRAARWDRRLAQVAAVLLVAGVGLNVAIASRTAGSHVRSQQSVAESSKRQSLVDTAVVVAESTDPATGRRFAAQLAAMSGRELTSDEAAAIDAAVRQVSRNGSKG